MESVIPNLFACLVETARMDPIRVAADGLRHALAYRTPRKLYLLPAPPLTLNGKAGRRRLAKIGAYGQPFFP